MLNPNPRLYTPVLLKKQNNILPSPIVPINSRKYIDNNYRAFGLNLDFYNDDHPLKIKKLKINKSAVK